MYYEITVSRYGMHYFATAERSITCERDAKNTFNHFSDLFPAGDGYQITVTRYEKTGEQIFKNG